ncbi:DUF4270 family protein [uncultured Croceitalea sp.]|uniref:DUF4270 family protein n=1 Tax=uncultured Croceitalea sp. TaxID=1798908 RepID=UPI0033068DDD
MGFTKSFISVFTGICLLAVFCVSCEEESLDTIGEGVVSGEPFNTATATFDVFAFNKRISAVQTNRLPLYQVGVYNDPIYGQREAKITSQLTLANLAGNPTFGTLSQSIEDGADNDDSDNTIPENETVKEVILYMPYQLVPAINRDRDGDGVQDELDIDSEDPNSDTDGDGVTDNEERILGSNPLDPSEDGSGDDFVSNAFPVEFALDSIFSSAIDQNPSRDVIGTAFGLRVEQSTFFLRNLDPNTNFQEAQEYFSNSDVTTFTGAVLADTTVTISNKQYLFFNEDDPDTETDESATVDERLDPGVRIKLDPQFFQDNFLDKEGSSELFTQSNFTDFLRGLHFTLTPTNGEDLMVLFDLSRSNITINYEYDDFVVDDSEEGGGSVEKVEAEYILSFLQNVNNFTNGNAVNTFIDNAFSSEIANSLDNDENASRLYLKGGSGTFVELDLFETDGARDVINEIKANNWIINEANLVFYVDEDALSNVGGVIEPPRLYLFNSETNAPIISLENEISISQSALGRFLNYDGILERGDDDTGLKYTVRITEHINDLVIRDEENITLRLSLTSDISITGALEAEVSPERVDLPVMSTINPLGTVLFGSNVEASEVSKKLQLQISYTEVD